MSVDVDYGAVLADLKAKRDKLDAAIAGIETMLDIRELSGETTAGKSGNAKNELGPGAFLGLTVVDATTKLLKALRQQQRTEDIVSALKQGGIAFTSENPINTVGSILNRNWSAGGDIVRVARGVWGLAEWHPRLRKKVGDAKNGESSSEATENDQESGAAAPEETKTDPSA